MLALQDAAAFSCVSTAAALATAALAPPDSVSRGSGAVAPFRGASEQICVASAGEPEAIGGARPRPRTSAAWPANAN